MPTHHHTTPSPENRGQLPQDQLYPGWGVLRETDAEGERYRFVDAWGSSTWHTFDAVHICTAPVLPAVLPLYAR